MKKFLLAILLSFVLSIFTKTNVYAGMQPLSPENVKKVVTTSATQSEFCKLEIGRTAIKDFSEALLRGYGSEGQDPYVESLDKMPCTSQNKEMIYGTLEITRNITGENIIYEQVFVIDDHYLRPTNLYTEGYTLTPTIPEQPQTDTSIMGIFKGISVKKGSLKHLSDVENNNYADEKYYEGEREFGYIVHLNLEGVIDNIYVLYQGNIYKYLQSLKEIKNVLLVEYDQKTEPTPVPDLTADWKTYEGVGFSFKYPPTWKQESKFVLTTERESNRKSSGDFTMGMGWIKILGGSEENLSDKEDVELDGKPGVKYSGYTGVAGSVWVTEVVTEIDGEPLVISFSTQDLPSVPQSEFNQILSTFKFTPLSASKSPNTQTVDTLNWKTFTSTKAKYSFKYPAEWPFVNVPSSIGCDVCVEDINFTPKYDPNSGDGTIALILVFKEDNVKTLDDFINLHVKGVSSIVNLQYTTIGGEKAASYKLSDGIPPLPVIEYVVVKNEMYYLIRLVDSDETNKNKEKNLLLFNQTLSTFKFAN